MNRFTRVLFRISRIIAGRGRSEWTDAMAAEAASLQGDATSWALGCLWASLKDRLARDWWFPAALVLLPLCVTAWKGMVFFWTASMLAQQVIQDWGAVTCWIVSPFPIALSFMLWRRGTMACVALGTGFVIVETLPLLMMWKSFGMSPLAWFGPNVNWYKADPGVTIGPLAGITLDLLVWLAAGWLGWLLHRSRPLAS